MAFYAITYKVYFKSYEQVDLNFDTYLLADSHGTPLKNYLEESGIYNFSAPSDSYLDMLIKIKYLVKHSKVKRIIIAVDDHSLSPYRENINNIERSAFYINKEDYSSIFNGVFYSLKKHLVLLNPGIRQIIRSYIHSFFIKKTKSREWRLLTDQERIVASRERFNFQFNFKNPSKKLTAALLDIIDLCKSNHIDLIGIQFPLSKTYFNIIKDNSFHADKVFYSKGLKVYDFRKLYQDHDDYFINQDHLNHAGSKDFIKTLLEKINFQTTKKQ
jgi:hypothetical protein